MSTPSFIWPIVGAPQAPFLVCDAFGPRLLAGTYDWHRGIDIAGQDGVTGVVAATSGQVRISADFDSRYPNCGKIIQIQHPSLQALQYRTNYCHLALRHVQEGETVSQGQLIGVVGQSSATYPHLHFEIRNGDTPHNPFCYLPAADLGSHAVEIASVDVNDLPQSLGMVVRATVARDQLDVVELRVRVFDLTAGGNEVDNKYIQFNEPHNCGTDNACAVDGQTQICIDPQHFWCDVSTWDVRFGITGLAASSLVTVSADLKNCSGVVKTAVWTNAPHRQYLPLITRP